MRHQKKKITLDRKVAARRSLIANLAQSLVLYEKIKTTLAKAKATRSVTEHFISVAKANNLAARRKLQTELYDKKAVKKLMEVLGPKYQERNGGYTRIIPLPSRRGDGSKQAIVELI